MHNEEGKWQILFMLMRSSSGWGGGGEGREEGPGVFEADKNGNVPLAAQHPCIKASCRSLGSKGGGGEVGRRRRRRGEGGEMSQLCLTGLRAELCGLMLGEGGWPPTRTHTHMQRHTHVGVRSC